MCFLSSKEERGSQGVACVAAVLGGDWGVKSEGKMGFLSRPNPPQTSATHVSPPDFVVRPNSVQWRRKIKLSRGVQSKKGD